MNSILPDYSHKKKYVYYRVATRLAAVQILYYLFCRHVYSITPSQYRDKEKKTKVLGVCKYLRMANKYRKKSNSANGPRTAKTFCKCVHQHQLRQHCGPQVFGITGCNACVVSNTKGVIELPMGDSDTYDVQ